MVGFLIAERTQLFIEVRKQTVVLSIADIPLAIGLLVVPSVGLLVARLLADLIVLVIRRPGPGKVLFNIGVDATEVAVAVAIAYAIGIGGGVRSPMTWVAVGVGAATADVIGAVLVLIAIRVTGQRPGLQRLASLCIPALVLGIVGSALGLVVLLVVSVNPWGVVLLLLVLLVFALGYRSYGRFLTQHERLGRVYAFSKMVESVHSTSPVVAELLDYVRETLNADRASVWLRGSAGQSPDNLAELISAGDSDDTGRAGPDRIPVLTIGADSEQVRDDSGSTDDPIREQVVADGKTRLLSARHGRRPARKDAETLRTRHASEVIVAALRAGDEVYGTVEVADRRTKFSAFSRDDIRLLDNLASHLAAALQNQQLVGQLRHTAYHDSLTGLANRERFAQATQAAVDETRGSGSVVGVLLLGLDSVRDVSDSLGHDAGDQLRIAMAARLADHVSATSVAARTGANEFAVLVRAPDLSTVVDRARALHAKIHSPVDVAGLTIDIGLSVGVAAWPDHAGGGATLLQRADVAMGVAKNTDVPIATYHASMDHRSLYRLQLVTDLRTALATDEVSVRYQPKVLLNNRELIGVEALLRWDHPTYGAVEPDEFVPLAERTGLIGPLTTHVLSTALRQCRDWLDRGLRIAVAVNLSARNLLDPTFADKAVALLREIDVPADLLTFEITETSVMADPERSIPVLHRLHALGLGLAVDDFGTGYSSLAYLRRLPVDEVKIDKAFVLGMGTDLGDLAIVRAIVELGHSLGLRVVAEGVEDELSRDLLEGMDCDVMQGYLLSRALAPDRFDAWLAARSVPRPDQAGLPGRRLQIPN
ncbi:MAG TPA: bifunctional diguanylate cyclase/phosphodiesterase [Mycobacteriales bacterium]|jgi:diguanylate cyclase (GGDEF)-like protein